MKSKGRVIALIMVITFFSSFYFFKQNNSLRKKRTIVLSANPDFSKTFQNKLLLFANWYQTGSAPAHQFTTELKNEFQGVERVEVMQSVNGSTYIKLWPYRPLVRVNEDTIITRSGKVLDAHLFTQSIQKSLPTVTLVQKDKKEVQIFPECLRFLNSFSRHLYEQFTVTWFDKTRIELQDKADKRFLLIASHETELSPEVLHQYQKLKEEIQKRTVRKKQWNIDMRFKNQVLVVG